MIEEIISRHRDGILEDGVPNPTLEVVCGLVAKAAKAITPAVQRRAFRNTGVTLAVDGSEDDDMCPSLKDLFQTKRSRSATTLGGSLPLHDATAEPS